MSRGRGSYHQRTVSHGFRNALIFFCVGQQCRRAHGGPGFAKRRFIRIDHAQVKKTQVAHGPRRRTNIERIACRNQYNAQAVEFGSGRQDWLFYLRNKAKRSNHAEGISSKKYLAGPLDILC